MKRKFAAFDIDGTLYRSSLYLDLVEKLIQNGDISKERAAIHYEMKRKWEERAHRESYEEFIRDVVSHTKESVQDLSVESVEKASESVVENNKNLVYTYTRDLITKLKNEGYFVLAISGSNSEVAEKFCQVHGFDAFSSSFWHKTDDNKSYTGKISDLGKDKAAQLKSMVEQYELTFEDSYGIGDSRGDITLLELVDHPIVFNPELHLLGVARQRNWKIVVERKNVIYELGSKDGSYILA